MDEHSARPARMDEYAAYPFVKWVGSKRQLVPELLRRLPTKFDAYHEPFAGGAALFFALAAEREPRFEVARLNDSNGELIGVYNAVEHHLPDLIQCLKFLGYEEAWNSADRRREIYGELRDAFNRDLGMYHVMQAARFLLLNRSCFNGLWRVNKSAKFNVPIGSYRTISIDRANLARCSSALRRHQVVSTSDPFKYALVPVGRGSVVYLDPPYANEGESFVGYAAGGFDLDQQRELADLAQRAADRGAFVLASNGDSKEVRKFYELRGFRVEDLTSHTSVGARAGRRGARNEILCSKGGEGWATWPS